MLEAPRPSAAGAQIARRSPVLSLSLLPALALVLVLALALAACQSPPATHAAAARTRRASVISTARQTAVRQAFIDAMRRLQLEGPPGSSPAPSSTPSPAPPPPRVPDSLALQHYILYDYLVAARLRRALQIAPDDALDSAIARFLDTHAGQPVVRDLRHDWLESLADRQQWKLFLPRAAHVSDPLLVCDRLAGRLVTGDTAGLAVEALAWWQQLIEQPPACNSVFAWLKQQGLLTPEQAVSRTRAALAAGNVRLALQFAVDVPPEELAPLSQWALLLQSPRSGLAGLAARPDMPVEPQALEAGFTLLTLRDSAAAAALLPSLLARPDMTPALRSRLQRDAALGLAYDHDPAALTAFLAMPPLLAQPDGTPDVRLLEWRVRAALWAGDYAQALLWIDAMPPSLATEPRWRYWSARATEAMQGAAAAQPLYAAIAGLRDYYGYLAADRLQRPYDLNAHATPDDPAVQIALGAEPGLLRAHELLICGMYDDAVAEWAAALRGATDTTRIQAAHLAARWGWYTQSIATLAQAGDWDDVQLRYPRPYSDLITDASRRTHLPADWILAVMRQESLFRPDAISRANARGLMQLLPQTANEVAQRWHLSLSDVDALFDPATAVALGAAHLRELLDDYDGHIVMALAAYNAGAASLTRWLPDKPMDADVWIENIPFDETRTYVESILEHIVAYGWTRGATPPRLAALLPPVSSVAAQPALGILTSHPLGGITPP